MDEIAELMRIPLGEIDHVAIAVSDVDSSSEFYVNSLGYKVERRRQTVGSSSVMSSVVLRRGSTVLVLVEGSGPKSPISRFVEDHGPGVHHIGIAVSDIEQAVADMQDAGLEVSTPIIGDVGGNRQVFCRPNPRTGVRLELIERSTPGFSDKAVESLLRHLEVEELP